MVFEPTDKTNCTIAQCIMNKMVYFENSLHLYRR